MRESDSRLIKKIRVVNTQGLNPSSSPAVRIAPIVKASARRWEPFPIRAAHPPERRQPAGSRRALSIASGRPPARSRRNRPRYPAPVDDHADRVVGSDVQALLIFDQLQVIRLFVEVMPAKLVFAGKPFRQHRQHQRIDAGALLTPLLKKIVERDGPAASADAAARSRQARSFFMIPPPVLSAEPIHGSPADRRSPSGSKPFRAAAGGRNSLH